MPFDIYHRNDQPVGLRAAYHGRPPVVAAETNRGYVMLLGPQELAAGSGSVERLNAAVEAAVTRSELSWLSQDEPAR